MVVSSPFNNGNVVGKVALQRLKGSARGWYGMAEHTRAWHGMVWHVVVSLGSCIQLEEQCNCSANWLCQMVVVHSPIW